MFAKIKGYILLQGKDPATWRGLIMLCTSVGVGFNPDQVAAIVTAGTALVGLVGVFSPPQT